jgi:hypothetical protein
VTYDEAGMFVSYLIDSYGLDTMKQAFCSVSYEDPRETILLRFEEVFGITLQAVEDARLAFLDSQM